MAESMAHEVTRQILEKIATMPSSVDNVAHVEGMRSEELDALCSEVIAFVENASGLKFVFSKQMSDDSAEHDYECVVGCPTTEMHKNWEAICRIYLTRGEESKIQKCEVFFNSPLHSRQKGEWTSVQSSGDVVDYLLLHMYPNLVLIRSLSYLSFLTSLHPSNNHQDAKDLTLSLKLHYNEEEYPKLQFEIENPKTNQKAFLKFPYQYDQDRNGKLGPQLTFFSLTEEKKIQHVLLDSYHNKEYYDAFDLDNETFDFVEHSFAADFETMTFVPHPITSKMMNAVLGCIGLGCLSIYDE